VGHWTLDSEVAGLVNLGSDGATSNLGVFGLLPLFSASGGYDGGGYATFDGATQGLRATVAGNAADDLSDYPFSFSAWIRPTGTVANGAGRAAILSIGAQLSPSRYYAMEMGYGDATNSGDFEAIRRSTGFREYNAVGSYATLTDGSWHHVATVMSSTTAIAMYIDGVLVTNTDPATPPTVAFDAFVDSIAIGSLARNSLSDVWKGDIDDPRLFNHALSATEVAALAGVVTGDFDGDGDVDGADFVAWQTNFPLPSGATSAMGDADFDGDVDGADFASWQEKFPAGSMATAAVPEPSGAAAISLLGLISYISLTSGKLAKYRRKSATAEASAAKCEPEARGCCRA
jgi:hypothetical protein